jgi:CheY-like chemotaxis protein
MAQALAAFYRARLTFGQPGAAGLEVTLIVAAPEQSTLLVIDDNADWIALVQRYLADNSFLVVGCSASELAAGLAEKLQPSMIHLDVMMHNVDGWQVLGELRNEPAKGADAMREMLQTTARNLVMLSSI